MARRNTGVVVSVCALGFLFFSADLFVTAEMSPTVAMPKSGAKGQTCINTGTERREGKDAATGEKLDCLWDYCEYCENGATDLTCANAAGQQGVRKRDYDNARDCKAVASRPGGAAVGPQTINPGVLAPDTSSPPTRGPQIFRPGGTLQRFQQQ